MTTNTSSTRKISLAEVQKHKTKQDVWIIIHNDVLDVTPFLAEHPGGEQALLDVAGTDASLAFDGADHSNSAKEMLARYKIGCLE